MRFAKFKKNTLFLDQDFTKLISSDGSYSKWLLREEFASIKNFLLSNDKMMIEGIVRIYELSPVNHTSSCNIKPMESIVNDIMSRVQMHRSEIFNMILGDSKGHIVTFMVKEKKLCAPKVMLTAQSDVFAKMLDSEWKEAKEKCVTIEDIEPEVFSELLRFLITGAVSNDEVLNFELYALAEKVILSGGASI